jgi:hypothetical protein
LLDMFLIIRLGLMSDIEYLCLQLIGLFVVLQRHPTDYSLLQVTAGLYRVSNLPFFLSCCYH